VDGRLFFGLPGNPASVAVLFEVLVRPALRRLQGFETLDRPRFEVRAGERIASRAGRADFARVTLAWREGAWWAHLAGAQVSGHLTPQARAHALLEVPPERDALEPGEIAVASLLRWPA
jgi:molybdopterin molybdotransferase